MKHIGHHQNKGNEHQTMKYFDVKLNSLIDSTIRNILRKVGRGCILIFGLKVLYELFIHCLRYHGFIRSLMLK